MQMKDVEGSIWRLCYNIEGCRAEMCISTIYRGFPTRMAYLYTTSCLRYTILVGNPGYIDSKRIKQQEICWSVTCWCVHSFRCVPQAGTSPLFGVNAAADCEGVVRVGDPVYAIYKWFFTLYHRFHTFLTIARTFSFLTLLLPSVLICTVTMLKRTG